MAKLVNIIGKDCHYGRYKRPLAGCDLAVWLLPDLLRHLRIRNPSVIPHTRPITSATKSPTSAERPTKG